MKKRLHKKLRIGVLMGGRSTECEVSFNSGRTICDHIDSKKYDIVPIFQKRDGTLFMLPWHFLHRGKITDFEHRLSKEAQRLAWDTLPTLIDFMYIATHGRYAEDGTLQGFLNLLNIPYLGSDVLSSALRMDKIVHKKMLNHHNIKTPKHCAIYPHEITKDGSYIDQLTNKLEQHDIAAPYVVKPHNEGSSIGVSIASNAQELHKAIITASSVNKYTASAVVIEEKIEGMEFSCIIIADYKTDTLIPLAPTEIVTPKDIGFFDYEQKYMPGKSTRFTPPRCCPSIIKKIEKECIKVMRILNFSTIARIDGFVTTDEDIIIFDPNSLSGMDPSGFIFRAAAENNMSHTHIINHLIETELYQHGMIEKIDTHKDSDSTMIKEKKRIAVLMGGESNEREISLESGRNIVYKLSPHEYQAIPIFVSQEMKLYQINQSLLIRNATKEIETLLDQATPIEWDHLKEIADFVFIGLHGGHGENGSVQGTLEMLDLPYNGSSVLASALCIDKYKTAEFLHMHGFDVPHNILISQDRWRNEKELVIQSIVEQLAFPIIVKPNDDGCSTLVSKVKNTQELTHAINEVLQQNKHDVLVEECIDGMELTVGVIGNDEPQALPPSQAVSAAEILSIEEKFLPGAGENQTPAPLDRSTVLFVQKTIENAYKAIGCSGYARIDCFYQTAQQSKTGKQRLVILEVNTLPGLTPATCIFHQAAEIGLKPMDFIDKIVKLGFKLHDKQALTYTTRQKKLQL